MDYFKLQSVCQAHTNIHHQHVTNLFSTHSTQSRTRLLTLPVKLWKLYITVDIFMSPQKSDIILAYDASVFLGSDVKLHHKGSINM